MKRFVILGSIVVALIVIWSAGWFFISSQIRTQVVAMGAAGSDPELTCASLDVGGYPFRFNVTCANVRLVSGDLEVTAPALKAAAFVFQPTLYQIFADAPITVRDAFSGAQSRITWDILEASLRFDGWRLGRASIVGDGVTWTDTLAGETPLGSAKHLEFHLVDQPEKHDAATATAVLEGYLALTGLDAPAQSISAADLTADVTLTALPDDVRRFGEPDAIRAWQQAGGTLSLNEIKGNDAAGTITVTGNLNLNDTGQAQGSIVIASKGIVERLGGLVPPELAPLVFGAPDATGAYSNTLTLINGVIFAGLLPLGGVPALF